MSAARSNFCESSWGVGIWWQRTSPFTEIWVAHKVVNYPSPSSTVTSRSAQACRR